MAEHCSECGTYTGGKPVVEFRRRPEIRAWEVYVYRTDRNGHEQGASLRFWDDGSAGATPVLNLVEGVALNPPDYQTTHPPVTDA